MTPADQTLRQYRRREKTEVTAIPIRLEPAESGAAVLFRYRKWEAEQRCKPGDWLVQNGEDVYTVDARTFERTYECIAPGRYRKTGSVWAERAPAPGVISTQEGATQYEAGDWLVYNQRDRKDGYAMGPEKFEQLYVLADEAA
jgi:hypothetical protein